MRPAALALLTLAAATPAAAQDAAPRNAEVDALRAELARTRAELARQETRLRALEARFAGTAARTPAAPPVEIARAPAGAPTSSRVPEAVGVAPAAPERPPEVAVLGEQGSVVTSRGQLTGDFQFDYARADRNRAVALGVSVAEVINIGIFNLNEVRQDVLTASFGLRYGLGNRFEVGARLPYVYRDDTLIISPLPGDNQQEPRTLDRPADGQGIGDVEISARYQLNRGRGGWPFLTANLQVVAPTGSDPFKVDRRVDGTVLESATGSGSWVVAPSVTAILPSDPAVLFGTLGYTVTFARDVNTVIAGTLLEYVDPGDSISFSGGVGLALNQRVVLNLGYAHNWAFGTETRQVSGEGTAASPLVRSSATGRDLQLGRFLFGLTYRLSDRTAVNWAVEVGATDDATDLRTSLRIPLTILSGR